ncbi:MAG: SRPBCC domain-containing protein [Cyclobacteriaceae bacterium]
MKKITKITLALLAGTLVALVLLNQLVSRSIRTEIQINAPADKVWDVLMDHEKYSDWNPFIKKISGNTRQGESLSVTIQSPGNSAMDFEPIVLINHPAQEFRWEGKLFIKGLFDGEHYFIINQSSPGKVTFIHGENFKGLVSGLLTKLILDDTQIGFELMNEALKSRAEKHTI